MAGEAFAAGKESRLSERLLKQGGAGHSTIATQGRIIGCGSEIKKPLDDSSGFEFFA
jgi:hypothetical protein